MASFFELYGIPVSDGYRYNWAPEEPNRGPVYATHPTASDTEIILRNARRTRDAWDKKEVARLKAVYDQRSHQSYRATPIRELPTAIDAWLPIFSEPTLPTGLTLQGKWRGKPQSIPPVVSGDVVLRHYGLDANTAPFLEWTEAEWDVTHPQDMQELMEAPDTPFFRPLPLA